MTLNAVDTHQHVYVLGAAEPQCMVLDDHAGQVRRRPILLVPVRAVSIFPVIKRNLTRTIIREVLLRTDQTYVTTMVFEDSYGRTKYRRQTCRWEQPMSFYWIHYMKIKKKLEETIIP
jgi:hypothetical protein